MYRKSTHLLVAAAVSMALALAQGPKGPAGNPDAPRTGGALDVTQAKTVNGEITAIQIAAGAQYPSIVVGQTQIKIAPVWFLLDNDLELKVGEIVEVLAAPCACADGSLSALSISNGVFLLTLRDSVGQPLWLSKGNSPGTHSGPNPAAPRTGDGCLDAASSKSITGVIESVSLGLGIQQPTLILKADGAAITIKLGPERILFEHNIELKPGDTVTVRYGLATVSNQNVALSLTAGGVTVVLRQDDGRPAWNN